MKIYKVTYKRIVNYFQCENITAELILRYEDLRTYFNRNNYKLPGKLMIKEVDKIPKSAKLIIQQPPSEFETLLKNLLITDENGFSYLRTI